jgi:hypothetical protein
VKADGFRINGDLLRKKPSDRMTDDSQLGGTNEILHDQGASILGVCRIWADQKSRLRTELIAQILRKFEEVGEAMRYLNARGEIGWRASPGMLSRLADAEQEVWDDESAEWS